MTGTPNLSCPPAMLFHATAVMLPDAQLGDWAVLLRGPSGVGKSDLALRLIDRGAVLVSDDQTLLSVAGGRLVAAPPAAIAGRLEARGLGIVDLPHRVGVPVALRSEEHTSELQSLMRISYAVF